MNTIANRIIETLDEPFPITEDQINFFQKNGFIKLRNVLSAEAIQYMNEVIYA